MGPRKRQVNAKPRMKQTSTPLKEGGDTFSLPSFKNISTVKVLRKRTIILNTESSVQNGVKRKKSSTSCQSRQYISIVSKKHSSKIRPDTPLKPRRSSTVTRLSVTSPKRLKFSQISESLDLPETLQYNEYCGSSVDEASVNKSEPMLSVREQIENIDYLCEKGIEILPADISNPSSMSESKEHNPIDIPPENDIDPQSSLSKKILNRDVSDDITRCSVLNEVDPNEVTMDSSSPVESFRKQSGSLLIPSTLSYSSSSVEISRKQSGSLSIPSTLSYSFDLNVLSAESLNSTHEEYRNLHILRQNMKSKSIIEDKNANVFLENDTFPEKLASGNKTPLDDVSTCSYTISGSLLELEVSLDKNIDSKNMNKDTVFNAQDKSASTIITNEKFNDCAEDKTNVVDILKEPSFCKAKTDVVELSASLGRNPPASVPRTANEVKEKKETFIKPLIKKYRNKQKKQKNTESFSLRPNIRKKGIKKGSMISFPSTSTPLNSPTITNMQLAAPFGHISPLTEDNLENCPVDDLIVKGLKDLKVFGKRSKLKRKSEASRRWESFICKDTEYYTGKVNNMDKEPRKRKRVAPRNQIVLFQTPPSHFLDSVPIDDIVKSRYESMTPKVEDSEIKGKNEIDKKRSRKKWYQGRNFEKLAKHFHDISKYSLIIERKGDEKK